MKKEFFAVALILVILGISLFNIRRIEKITQEITLLIDEAEIAAEAGDWITSERKAEKASDIWESHDPYTHIVLVHSDTDAIYDALYELQKEIYSRDKGAVKGTAKRASNDLKSMSQMEKLRIGSIF